MNQKTQLGVLRNAFQRIVDESLGEEWTALMFGFSDQW